MTALIDRRPSEAKEVEQLSLRHRLYEDLKELHGYSDPVLIWKAVDLILQAQDVGIIELYLQEFNKQAVQNRYDNCTVFHAAIANRSMSYGQRMVLAATMLSTERSKLIEDMVKIELSRSPSPIYICTDSAQKGEVIDRVEKVLKGEEVIADYVCDSKLGRFFKAIFNAFKNLVV